MEAAPFPNYSVGVGQGGQKRSASPACAAPSKRSAILAGAPAMPPPPVPATGLTWAGGDERHRHPLRTHPERPERVTEILKHLRATGLTDRCSHVAWPGWDAPDDDDDDGDGGQGDASDVLSVSDVGAALAEVSSIYM